MPSANPFALPKGVPQPRVAEGGAFEIFKRRLTVVPADSEELLDRVFQLRFQVYCVERGFEDAAGHPEGRERDDDDRRSLHFLVLDRATGEAAGTVRLILPQIGNDLPVFRLSGTCRPAVGLPQGSTAEVSRFAIAKAFRRQLEASWRRGNGGRTALPIITFGLIQAIVMMSAIGGITHIVAMMEPALLRLLRRMGIEFHPVGGLVEHHGLRQPGWAAMAGLAERVKECHRELWEIATEAGRRLPAASPLALA
jgi:N-acyl amino acid synthase of PEP-CTERM/exosortase system